MKSVYKKLQKAKNPLKVLKKVTKIQKKLNKSKNPLFLIGFINNENYIRDYIEINSQAIKIEDRTFRNYLYYESKKLFPRNYKKLFKDLSQRVKTHLEKPLV